MSAPLRTIGVIGGSGIQNLGGAVLATHRVSTPWGAPSAAIEERRIGELRVLFLPRHGVGHTIPPHRVNYRANIDALVQLGTERIITASSVGSLQAELPPGTFVVPNQFLDFTHQRPTTFFDGGRVVHLGMADPFCPELTRHAVAAGQEMSILVRENATYVCIEGPRFSTRAESRFYRTLADIIGMTLVPEITLARERGLCYLCLATVTDFDVWQETPVQAEEVVRVMRANTDRALQLLGKMIPRLAPAPTCACAAALRGAEI
ncbi:MAG: S-methyl-5'-thioadenosine phosphorylase [Thermoplasmata archaeon]|nr:S-methyl-5'-thioadenosine phosphorylase [Thermoplasmata archaeon]